MRLPFVRRSRYEALLNEVGEAHEVIATRGSIVANVRQQADRRANRQDAEVTALYESLNDCQQKLARAEAALYRTTGIEL